MASGVYTTFKEYVGDGTIDLDNDSFKVILLNSVHTFVSANATLNQVNDNEITGTNYSVNGSTLSSVTWTADGTAMVFDAADTAWSGASISARHAVIYDSTVDSNLLVCSMDFSASQTVSNGVFTLQYNASGLLRFD